MASPPTLRPLGDVLLGIKDESWNHALYMPLDEVWTEATPAAIIDHDELEDDESEDAFVEQRTLYCILGVGEVRGIVINAEAQIGPLEVEDLIEALKFYYDNDAFIEW